MSPPKENYFTALAKTWAVCYACAASEPLNKRWKCGSARGGTCAEKSNAINLAGLLRAHRERPGERRAAKRGHELPPSDFDCH